VKAPYLWSQTATDIVASKYFRGRLGTRERESSVRQLLDRVTKTITKWGVKGQYFLDEEEAQIFEAELTHILLNQKAAFNSPVSFMKGYDAFAGVIKSGGRTRRAAKLVILNADHPDVVEFIWSKANEEKKPWALIDAGYDGAVDGEAYGSVFFQYANHSVRVTDDFMHAVTDNKEWQTHYITNHKVADTYKARDLMRQMAEAAYICGDPGIQFDT